MHLDSVVLRHYNLQMARSSKASSKSYPPQIEKLSSSASVEISNNSTQSPVAVKTPADYPPLEPIIDLRIPMHFSQFDSSTAPQIPDSAAEVEHFVTTTSKVFSETSPPYEATVHVCCLQDPAGENESPRFVAVVTKSQEVLARWPEVHAALSQTVQEIWPAWRHPAIRYLREGKHGFPKFR